MSLHSPRCSVMLSSYNHDDFLVQAVESVLTQSFTDFELLIYDDASTDNSLDIIRSFTDPRIRVFAFSHNRKRESLLEVLGQARGEYLAVHHSDDVWTPDKLEKQISWLDAHPDCGAVFTLVQPMDDSGLPVDHSFADIFQQPNRSRWEWLHELFFHNVLCHPSVLLRTQTYRDIHRSRMQLLCNDWRAWILLCLRHNIHIIQEKLTWFRVHKDMNTGGPTIANTTRMRNEISFLLELFRTIGSTEDWVKVFPEAKQYIVEDHFVSDYALARICIATTQPCYIQYGLHLLARSMETEEQIRQLEDVYHFTANNYIALCASYPVYRDDPMMYTCVARLFVLLDGGSALSEISQKTYDCSAYGEFTVKFVLKEFHVLREQHTVTNLILVLSEEQDMECCLYNCSLDGVPQMAIPQQAVSDGDRNYFFTTVPRYSLSAPCSGTHMLKVQGIVRPLTRSILKSRCAMLEKQIQRVANYFTKHTC